MNRFDTDQLIFTILLGAIILGLSLYRIFNEGLLGCIFINNYSIRYAESLLPACLFFSSSPFIFPMDFPSIFIRLSA